MRRITIFFVFLGFGVLPIHSQTFAFAGLNNVNHLDTKSSPFMWTVTKRATKKRNQVVIEILGIQSRKSGPQALLIGTVQVNGNFTVSHLLKRPDNSFVAVCHFDKTVTLPWKEIHSKGGIDGLLLVFKDKEVVHFLPISGPDENYLQIIEFGEKELEILCVGYGEILIGSEWIFSPYEGMSFFQILISQDLMILELEEAPAQTVLDFLRNRIGHFLRDSSLKTNLLLLPVWTGDFNQNYELIQEDTTPHDPSSDDD